MLVCGILAALLYAVANDLLAALLWKGYSPFSQAVSELTSLGAPTRTPLLFVGFLFAALLVAFGLGIWRSAQGNRALRIAAGLIVAYGAVQPLWVPFPMTGRGKAEETMAVTDVAHIGMAVLTVLFMFATMAFGAAALGGRFRLYSVVTIAVALVSGTATFGYVPRIDAREPTPWFGVLERVDIAAWLLWLAVLAVALLRAGHVARKR